MEGWIKLHREFIEWEWFDNSNMVKLFLWMLLKCNYEDKTWHGIEIKKGSFITSLANISKDVMLPEQKIRSCIMKLKSTNEITTKSTNKFTIITMCKYEDYQNLGNLNNEQNNEQNNKQITNKQQTNNKQITTTKEYKEIKKERKEEILSQNQNFFFEECKKAENENSAISKHFIVYVDMLQGKTKDLGEPFNKLLSLKDPVSFERYKQLADNKIENVERIKAKTISMECDQKIKMVSFNKTLTKWFNSKF